MLDICLHTVRLSGFLFMRLVCRDFRDTDNFGCKLKNFLCSMGPVFIKFGQVLSARPDLVGYSVARELSIMQDKIEPAAFRAVRKIIYKDFGVNYDDLFLSFDVQVVAAASVAQVYKAVTLQNEVVAVKILRPGIHKKIKKDIKLLRFLMSVVSIFFPAGKLNFLEVLDKLHKTLLTETDLRFEAANASQLAENMKYDIGVYVPKVYWDYVSCNVAVFEWIDGFPLNDPEMLLSKGFSGERIARNLAMIFFNQVYRDGFFHADMHPGNLMVNKNCDIVLLDFGITDSMDMSTRVFLAEILIGFLRRDYEHVAEMHFKYGYVDKNENKQLFIIACRAIGEGIVNKNMSSISVASLLTQLFKIAELFNMKARAELLMFHKSLILVEGMGSRLYPAINLWHLAAPLIEEWSMRNMSARARCLRGGGNVVDDLQALYTRIIDGDQDHRVADKSGKKYYIMCYVILLQCLIISLLVYGIFIDKKYG